jgi:hypothetical protein
MNSRVVDESGAIDGFNVSGGAACCNEWVDLNEGASCILVGDNGVGREFEGVDISERLVLLYTSFSANFGRVSLGGVVSGVVVTLSGSVMLRLMHEDPRVLG